MKICTINCLSAIFDWEHALIGLTFIFRVLKVNSSVHELYTRYEQCFKR
ncbi:hypothetical protein ACTFH7_11200 [Clostridium cagae]